MFITVTMLQSPTAPTIIQQCVIVTPHYSSRTVVQWALRTILSTAIQATH